MSDFLAHGARPERMAEWYRWCAEQAAKERLTGDCEVDCIPTCATPCGVGDEPAAPDDEDYLAGPALARTNPYGTGAR